MLGSSLHSNVHHSHVNVTSCSEEKVTTKHENVHYVGGTNSCVCTLLSEAHILCTKYIFWQFCVPSCSWSSFIADGDNTSPDTTLLIFFFLLWRCDPTRVMGSSFLKFLDHTQRRTTVGRTPLDEWSARRRDLYLTTHNIHNRQTSMPPVGFESTISEEERPQIYALDRAATGTCIQHCT